MKRNSDLETLQYPFVKRTRFIPVFLIPPAVKERWILFWKCAIPILSTGVAFQEDSLESSIQVPLSAFALTLLSSVQGLQVCYLFSNFSI